MVIANMDADDLGSSTVTKTYFDSIPKDIINELTEYIPEGMYDVLFPPFRVQPNGQLAVYAAENNYLSLLVHALDLGQILDSIPTKVLEFESVDVLTCIQSRFKLPIDGHLLGMYASIPVLEYFSDVLDYPCLNTAAYTGDVDRVRFIHPRVKGEFVSMGGMLQWICLRGYVPMLEYLASTGLINMSDHTEDLPPGNAAVVDFLHRHNYPFTTTTHHNAIVHADAATVRRLEELGCPHTPDEFVLAIKSGRRDIIDYMLEKGHTYSEGTLRDAIWGMLVSRDPSSYKDILMEYQRDWTPSYYSDVFEWSHMSQLKFLLSIPQFTHPNLVNLAIRYGQTATLEWLLENGHRWDHNTENVLLSSVGKYALSRLERHGWVVSSQEVRKTILRIRSGWEDSDEDSSDEDD